MIYITDWEDIKFCPRLLNYSVLSIVDLHNISQLQISLSQQYRHHCVAANVKAPMHDVQTFTNKKIAGKLAVY